MIAYGVSAFKIRSLLLMLIRTDVKPLQLSELETLFAVQDKVN